MRSSNVLHLISIFLFPAITLAQSTTLPVFILDTDPQPLVASVVSANSATTSLAINCSPGVDASDCGMGPGLDLEHISGSIWQASMTAPEEGFSFSWSCQVATASAVCVTSAGGDQANDPGMTTTTLSASDITSFPVTVTAGAESLSASGAGTATMTSSGASEASTASKTMPTASGVSATATSSTNAAKSSSAAAAGAWSKSFFGAGVVLAGFVTAHLVV